MKTLRLNDLAKQVQQNLFPKHSLFSELTNLGKFYYKRFGQSLSYPDYQSYFYEAFDKALIRWDFEKSSFHSYLVLNLRAVLQNQRNYNSMDYTIHTPILKREELGRVSTEELIEEIAEEEAPENLAQDLVREFEEFLNGEFCQIENPQRVKEDLEFLKLYLEDFTYAEIGAKKNLTRERVRQKIERIYEVLRKWNLAQSTF